MQNNENLSILVPSNTVVGIFSGNNFLNESC